MPLYLIMRILCILNGETGAWLQALLCAVGYNIRWLLRIIAKKGGSLLAAIMCAHVHSGERVAELAEAFDTLLTRAFTGSVQRTVGARI